MSSHTTERILLRVSADFVDSSWKRDKGTPRKKSWEGATIKILQNLTVGDRSLSGGIGNETVVLKGVWWTSSQGLEARRATKK